MVQKMGEMMRKMALVTHRIVDEEVEEGSCGEGELVKTTEIQNRYGEKTVKPDGRRIRPDQDFRREFENES
jgi:hypothetical protein